MSQTTQAAWERSRKNTRKRRVRDPQAIKQGYTPAVIYQKEQWFVTTVGRYPNQEAAMSETIAARESAMFGQFEPAFGVIPGAGAIQHLARLMGRARALEVMLSAEDYDAELAERYGWINRALPAKALGEFVRALAHRIARFPAAGQVVVKDRINALTLASPEDFRRDSDLFVEGLRKPEAQSRIQAAMKRGFQT